MRDNPLYTRRKMSRAWRYALLALLVLVSVGGGGWVANNLIFGGRAQAVPGTPHTLRVQLGVSERDVALVTEGLRLADGAFRELLGAHVAEPVTVRLARRTPCIAFARRTTGTAHADADEICVDTTKPTWRYAVREEPTLALSIVAHEHLHNLQGQLGCLPGPDEHTHLWLVEGTATYMGWQTVRRAGLVTDAGITREMRAWGGFRPDLKPLSSYERILGGDPEYALAHRAVRRLVVHTGTPASLVAFCQQVGAGRAWKTALHSSFGTSVEAFYAAFEASRRR